VLAKISYNIVLCWPWPLTLKINKVPDSLKDEVCTKFGQNPLKYVDSKYVDSRVFTRIIQCYTVKIWPSDLWPWKSIGFQILLRTKYVPSLVKIHWRMLIIECSQGCYGRTDGSVTISLRNFVGEGIIKVYCKQNHHFYW
jgi:hypothetical protein